MYVLWSGLLEEPEPDSFYDIIGNFLLQDHGEREMIRSD